MAGQGEPSMVEALAAGDFRRLAERFARGGLKVASPEAAILQVCMPSGVTAPASTIAAPARMRLLISVGVHGNETAPIEMLASVLDRLAETPAALGVDLLLVVGNPAAIATGARFVDADLNRLFCSDLGERGALASTAEAARADVIMRAGAAFFKTPAAHKWHLDLHSAIRPSRYARFAVVPATPDDAAQAPLLGWLGSAAIDAVMFNSQRAATFSAYTAQAFGALSCTVELGQVAALGQNPAHLLAGTEAALAALLRGQVEQAAMPVRFRVAQEIIRHSDGFAMAVDTATHNFTPMAPGSVIATDGEQTYRVGPVTEYVVFPNPRVLLGQRAGLMVVLDGGDAPV